MFVREWLFIIIFLLLGGGIQHYPLHLHCVHRLKVGKQQQQRHRVLRHGDGVGLFCGKVQPVRRCWLDWVRGLCLWE